MRPARLTTRWPRCSAWAIRAGVVIDRLAAQGDAAAIHFTRPFLDRDQFDFSFSGIKSAVMRHLQTHPAPTEKDQKDIAAGFQAAVVDVLTYKIIHAARARGCHHLAVVGGVAANRGLRESVTQGAADENIRVHIPAVELCGDNAAMVAAVGYHRLAAGERSDMDEDVYSRIKFRPINPKGEN